MKNFLFPTMLLAAAALVSCSEDEPNIGDYTGTINSSDLVSINTYAGTTKGDDTTTATLETSQYVELHIDDSNSIQESIIFVYDKDSDDWSQKTTSLKWSSIEFPANFYSLHDGKEFKNLSFTNDVATYTDYTVSDFYSSDHSDLVYHASVLNAIPTGATVNAYHKHALSKINIYAATGSNIVYIARVQLVNVDDSGTITITPLSADEISTANGVTWSNNETFKTTYNYFTIGNGTISGITSKSDEGADVIINGEPDAPMMIVPQSTTGATVTASSTGAEATVTDTYIEVIYYMTDSKDGAVVGYSAISALPDATEYVYTDDTDLPLYVLAAFPLEKEFEANMEYDITLGLGKTDSTGGILLADYYVDKDGDPITLTKKCDDGGTTTETPEIPEIDEGDDILGDSDDYIDIYVSDHAWSDGGNITVQHTSTQSED